MHVLLGDAVGVDSRIRFVDHGEHEFVFCQRYCYIVYYWRVCSTERHPSRGKINK